MTEIAYQTGEAATHLGVSHSMMRKIAQDYEAVFGSLGEPRMFTAQILETLQTARNLVSAGLAPSLKVALETLQADPDGTSMQLLPSPAQPAEPYGLNRADFELALREVITPLIAPVLQQNEMLLQQNHQLALEREQLLSMSQEMAGTLKAIQLQLEQQNRQGQPMPRVPTAEEIAKVVVRNLPEAPAAIPSDQLSTVDEVGDKVSEKVADRLGEAVKVMEEDLLRKMPNTMTREELITTIKEVVDPLVQDVQHIRQRPGFIASIASLFRKKPG